MKRQVQELKKLGEIASVQLEGALSALAGISRAEGKLSGEISELDAALRAALTQKQETLDAVNLSASKSQVEWLNWRNQHKRCLNERLAIVRARKEEALRSASQAFGRVHALESIRERVDKK